MQQEIAVRQILATAGEVVNVQMSVELNDNGSRFCTEFLENGQYTEVVAAEPEQEFAFAEG